MLAAVALPVHARDVRYVIRHAKQLENDRGVRAQRVEYERVSAANFVVTQCAADLALTDAQKNYITAQFTSVSTAYMQAFDAAFRSQTGVPSPQELVAEYTEYLRKVQQGAVNQIAAFIQQKTCNDNKISQIIAYYEKLQKLEAVAPAAVSQNPSSQVEDVSSAPKPMKSY